MGFTFSELFAGTGGFRLALEAVGGRVVFSSEIDKSARATYAANFGDVPHGDIRAFTGLEDSELGAAIPDHDLLSAGFPCQPFSRAGVSAREHLHQPHGFSCDVQGTLFFDIARIVKIKRPKVLLLENVRGLRSHDGGRTFATMQSVLSNDLGYTVHTKVIDAATLVPQRRLRCYIICIRDGGAYTFPEFDGEELPLASILELIPDPSLTISEKLWVGHIARSARNRARGAGFTADLADLTKPAHTLVARYGKDGKECLIPQKGRPPRMLSPRECARLQGYPESYVLPASRAAAYRQFGNAVAVPVVERIALSLLPFLEVSS